MVFPLKPDKSVAPLHFHPYRESGFRPDSQNGIADDPSGTARPCGRSSAEHYPNSLAKKQPKSDWKAFFRRRFSPEPPRVTLVQGVNRSENGDLPAVCSSFRRRMRAGLGPGERFRAAIPCLTRIRKGIILNRLEIGCVPFSREDFFAECDAVSGLFRKGSRQEIPARRKVVKRAVAIRVGAAGNGFSRGAGRQNGESRPFRGKSRFGSRIPLIFNALSVRGAPCCLPVLFVPISSSPLRV
jgi:hypothetical protein